MTSLVDLVDVLPAETIEAWPHVAAVAPSDGVLLGGTALAVHLRHRMSRDLDVFALSEFDPSDVEQALARRGHLRTELKTRGTLNGIFNGARVQFLWAQGQRQLEPPIEIEGLAVGGLADLYATKLNAVAGRGELRDYFDLMRIEVDTGRTVEEGVTLFMARYGVDETDPIVPHLVASLGYLDDVTDDPSLVDAFGKSIRKTIQDYWTKRQPRLLRNLDSLS